MSSVAVLVGSSQAAVPPVPVVECSFVGHPDGRVYRLVDRGSASQPRWWLTLRSPAVGERVVELPLPDARVERLPGRVTVSSASRNGGLAVEMDANAEKSRVEVFVNFELEVNVWRDLSPDVEHMNTDGPRTDARCRVLPSTTPFP